MQSVRDKTVMNVSRDDNTMRVVGLLTHTLLDRNTQQLLMLQSSKKACCLLVTKMCGSSGDTMVNVTENEALETLATEEELEYNPFLFPSLLCSNAQ